MPYLDKWEISVRSRKGFEKEKSQQERMMLSAETRLGLRMTGKIVKSVIVLQIFYTTAQSFVGLVKLLFELPEVKGRNLAFLSNNLCQDPIENFFGCQRQRGGTSDNPNVLEYYQNTQALRVVNSLCRAPVKGNCRGSKSSEEADEHSSEPLPKKPRKK